MPSRLSPRRAPKVSLNRSTVVEIKRKGCKSKKQTLLLNFDKNDLRQLMSCVERALHKSPSDPTVRVTSLSYLPAESKVTSSSGGGGGSVLDGTPFCPKSKQKKNSGGGSSSGSKGNRSSKFVRLTVDNFDPGLFLAMEEVRLAAVVVQEGEEENGKRDVINDENDRRLSNGSVSTSPASPADRGVGLSIGGSGKSPRSPSSPATSLSPPGAGAMSRTSTPQAGQRSSTACPAVARARSGGDGGSDAFSGSPSSPMDRSDDGGGSGCGGVGEFVLSVARAEASSPAVSALSSRAGSVDADQGVICNASGESGEGEHADEQHQINSSLCRNGCSISSGGGSSSSGSGSGSDEGSLDPTVGENSAASCSPSCATAPAPGHGDAKGQGEETPLASPAPGRRSILFRRASAASQLPPDMTGDDTESSSGSDGGSDGAANGGERGSGADQSEGGRGQSGGSGSTASSGVWKRADLAGGGGGGGDRPPSRRDAVGKGQARPRGRGSDKDKESTRWGGRREVVSGSASSRTKAGSSRSGSGHAAGAAKGDGGRRGKGKQAGGRSGDVGVKAQQRPATKKKELFPKDSAAAKNTKTCTKSAVSQPGAPKKRGDPTTPSCKKTPVDRIGTPATASTTKSNPACAKQRQQQRQLGTTTTAATTTPRKAQPADNTTTPRKQATPQPRSAWAAKPSERRQPPFKAVGTPKAKLPLRTNAAPPASATKSPRPKGGAAAAGRGGESGGSGGGGGNATGSDGGEGSPSPSKRPPPRVSASGHMAWERNLRSAVSSTPSKKHATNSTRAKTDTLRGGARKGGGYGTGRYGGGGGGRGGGEGGGEGGHGEEGRPSIGTWSTAQKYLQILKEISGKDDEELKWLVVAKQGKGVLTSEKRRESAETEYHRLLCEESMQKAGLELLRDRRLEVALKKVGKLGDDLELVSELLEELGGKEVALMEKAEEAQHQESVRVEAAAVAAEQAARAAKDATTEAAAAGTAAASAASLEEQGGAEECGGESAAAAAAAAAALAALDAQGAADKKEAEALAAAASVEEATREAAAARASRDEERGSVERAREEAEAKLGRVLEDIGAGKEKLRALGVVIKEECGKMPGGGGNALETIMGVTASVYSARELIAPARAKSGLRGIEAAAKELAEVLNKTRSDSQSALSRMEKWRQRKEELPEYEKEVADQEKAWFAREEPANQKALRRMRALIPVGVTGLTVAQLEEQAAKSGSLYPHELALRIKENRLLHWIVTHPDDIARSNFLKGDHAHFFTNLDRYDLVELRAILACLPGKFEVDGDGRKASWRALFLQRAQNLVAQERGDTVSGGWDMATNARREVRLPPLTGEQARRKEYFYPTAAEVEERVRKLQEREQRLEAKKAQLVEVKEKLLPEAKEEYANVLEDTRHQANKEAFSAEDLRRARDEAKAEVDSLAKEVKRLEGDVASAQRALRESPYTVQSLRDEAAATRRLLSERAKKARLLAKQQREKAEAEKAAAAAAVVAAAAAVAAAASDAATKEQGDDASVGDEDPSAATAAATAPAVQEAESARASAVVAVEEEDEVEQVEEGLEVEGAFDPDPELQSRFADKSSSLRFVTAEEDARMRKEELAKVFAAKAAEAAAAAACGLSAGTPVAAAKDALEGGDGAAADGKAAGEGKGGVGAAVQPLFVGGGAPAASAATGGSSGSLSESDDADATGKATAAEELVVGGGSHAKDRMKAFGAVLEKTLSQSFFERAPPPGSAAAAAAVGGGGVKARALMSPPRPSKNNSATAAAAAAAAAGILTPPCKPKSKFFRSIQSPSTAGQPDVGGVGGRSTVPSSPPPPPPPMMGLLSQIRARGDGGKAPAGMGGLLAQIRAKGGGGGDGDSRGVASLSSPPPPPPPPPPSLPQRSLFASSAGPSKAAQGPPPDLLAHIRAKAAERQTAV